MNRGIRYGEPWTERSSSNLRRAIAQLNKDYHFSVDEMVQLLLNPRTIQEETHGSFIGPSTVRKREDEYRPAVKGELDRLVGDGYLEQQESDRYCVTRNARKRRHYVSKYRGT